MIRKLLLFKVQNAVGKQQKLRPRKNDFQYGGRALS